ncbi:hypothetical protein FB45DRAFT_1006075 [Roridomyces roridus]|uniref:F-box domain-containing protein n=1 Tax=Roridomyces roridus TaxID=1738132 RepID=A0AAD7FJN9_9AGAR|nr:hypothetical protein FB45DRAFT_1006075 [Roridomyces roridus]
MSSICSECGETKISRREPSDAITATPETLAQYQRLSTSNDPPGTAERAFLQAVASKTTVRLTCLGEEILRLKDRLGQLQAERVQLTEYHSHNVAILSPLRRMPHEVLAEIFLRTLQPEVARNFNMKRSPWVLGRVNRCWRAVSLSTPSLWSTVCADYEREPPILEMIQAQVERASSRMLKIHFRGCEAGGSESDLDSDSDSGGQLELFKTLSKHSERWEELWIQLTPTLAPRLDALGRGGLDVQVRGGSDSRREIGPGFFETTWVWKH